MSTASSFPSPLAVRSEHLSMHTGMDGIHSYQSFPSAEGSVDEVQLGLDAQTDELSMEGDRAQIDELEQDTNESLQYRPDSDSHIGGVYVNGETELAETPQLAKQAHGQSDVIPTGSDQAVPAEEPQEELPQTDIETNALVSKTDLILQAETLGTTAGTDNTHFVSLGQEHLEIPEGEDFEFSAPLTEQDISVMAQDFAREVEEMTTEPSELQSSEHDSNNPDLEVVEVEPPTVLEPVVDAHEDVGAPPLRRMDDDTIPVTGHSKESIIDILNASGTATDEGVQPTTTEEQASEEIETATPTEVVPEQTDMELDTQDVVEPEGLGSTSLMAHVEHIHVEPCKEGDGENVVMEQDEVFVEQNDEPNVGATIEASINQQPVQIAQEGSDPAAQEEPATSDPTPDDLTTAFDDAAGPIVTVIEESTTIVEQAPVQETEQPEPSIVDPVPEVAMDATISTVISTDWVIVDSAVSVTDTGDLETDAVERAAQIQEEQDATVQTTEGETQTTLAAESLATANNTIVSDESPDPTAPKDSNSPSRRAPSQSQSQPQSQSEPASPQTSDLTDPPVIQNDEPDAPEESSEPIKPRYQNPDEPEAIADAGPSNVRKTPEWEGFAALDEGAPGSPEPEPSSEPSDHIDDDLPLDPASASTDKAKEPIKPSNSPTAPTRKRKKPRMIMEVVIPVAQSKPKVTQETKPTKKRGRPAKSKVPAPTEPEPLVASSSSSQRRSSSPGTSPPVKSESSESEVEPAPRMKKPEMKRPVSYGSRKRGRKAVASGPSTGTRPVHVVHATKLEVVMPRRPRPSLKATGSTPSGNKVKFAPASPVTGKRKAESEPDADQGSDADADGETDEEYEDVEEELEVKAKVVASPRPRKKMRAATRSKKASPVKRPRRSREARKAPPKLPELVSKPSRSPPKRRRLRR
ncbi:unnamed protein product [Rhizoctonia solani]|uniref:Uncharacterized protein n=1 Tax=Rhizoctonia solani TaxID=456999 RepID=A0A8H3E199_9AGAM|nr:unnamed protein product [Rhizoctonia solani]